MGRECPDHDLLITDIDFLPAPILVAINTEGEGKSKKMAEQEAARKALDILLS